MALPLFLHGLSDDLGLEFLFCIHLFQAPVLVFEFSHPSHERGVHAPQFGTPFVKGGRADSVLSTQLRYRDTSLRLLEYANNLTI